MNFDGVIFDMDGTLVEPLLDFEEIRRDLGVPVGVGILEDLQTRPARERTRLQARLLDYEMDAAHRARLLPGAAEITREARAAGMRTALLTRNTRDAMEHVLETHGLEFDLCMAREDGPIKPEPDGVLAACRELRIRPDRTLCVGDFEYELIAARRAGAMSALIVHEGSPRPGFAYRADYVIRRLDQLRGILEL
ncbi:MAG: HAD family hydrolase [Phycisphaerae bacterium]